MTVKELVDLLSEYNQDAPIEIWSRDDERYIDFSEYDIIPYVDRDGNVLSVILGQ